MYYKYTNQFPLLQKVSNPPVIQSSLVKWTCGVFLSSVVVQVVFFLLSILINFFNEVIFILYMILNDVFLFCFPVHPQP